MPELRLYSRLVPPSVKLRKIMPEVRQWAKIADNFRDTLVLGNGASVAVHSEFQYGSLKEEAEVRGFLTSDGEHEAEAEDSFNVEDVFQLLGTEDFELVLNLLC